MATSNPKVFLAHVRRNRQLNRQIISLKTDLGVIVKEPETQAELLHEFYYAVFRNDAGQPSPSTANSIGDNGHSRVYSLPRP